MKDIHEEVEFTGCPGDPDNESGIATQSFFFKYGLSYNDEVVFFGAKMTPDHTVQDPTAGEFPEAEFMLSIEDFKRFLKMGLRFDEQLSSRHE